MKTIAVPTRFMNAQRDVDGVIVDILVEKYGAKEVLLDTNIDWDAALFSSGFIHAIESGLTPVLSSIKKEEIHIAENFEYHHLLTEDFCYKVYFE